MHDSKQIIKKGTILTFSSGAYEDYNVSSVYSVNKEFNINELSKSYWYECAEKEYKNNPKEFYLFGADIQYQFIEYLIENKYISRMNEERIYMGDDEFFSSRDWEKDFKKQKGIKDE